MSPGHGLCVRTSAMPPGRKDENLESSTQSQIVNQRVCSGRHARLPSSLLVYDALSSPPDNGASCLLACCKGAAAPFLITICPLLERSELYPRLQVKDRSCPIGRAGCRKRAAVGMTTALLLAVSISCGKVWLLSLKGVLLITCSLKYPRVRPHACTGVCQSAGHLLDQAAARLAALKLSNS